MIQEIIFCMSFELSHKITTLREKNLKIISITPVEWCKIDKYILRANKFMILAESM